MASIQSSHERGGLMKKGGLSKTARTGIKAFLLWKGSNFMQAEVEDSCFTVEYHN